MDVEANNSLRSQIALFLEKHCPDLHTKGVQFMSGIGKHHPTN